MYFGTYTFLIIAPFVRMERIALLVADEKNEYSKRPVKT